MLKKTISVLLVICSLFLLMTPVSALKETGVISLKLNSDIAGLTYADSEQLFEIKSDNVVYSKTHEFPVSVSDYAGTSSRDTIVAGRTYYIDYSLSAADGYVLPEKLEKGDVEIECGKGVKVLNTQIVTGNYRQPNGEMLTVKGLNVTAKVLVDGNIFQRIAGFFYDIYLKIRAWSLY
ncbi:MAG: hypothetical protein IJU45_00710 [Clostridia bacterium]|nr:hypothetical protein [Clostridia bacterium]